MTSSISGISKHKKLPKLLRIHWKKSSVSNRLNFTMNADETPNCQLNIDKQYNHPKDFYSTLLKKCENSKKRITLASLYLGTGPLEKDLVESMKKAVISTNGNIEINILLDYMRGSRGKINSRMMLKPLLEDDNDGPDNCKIYLYHTPKLRGVLKSVMPNRFNELIGLQHMKIYIFDDSLIISGANLSNDYFTNRQDRYLLIEDCKDLCDFYSKLIKRVAEFSFRLLPDDTTVFENKISQHPLTSSLEQFRCSAQEKIQSLYLEELNKSKKQLHENSRNDTWVFPLIQMGQLGIRYDSDITLNLLKNAQPGSLLRLATSYFNLTSDYSNALLKNCQASCELLTAHPTANGFFKAKGVAGGIPAAYTKLEKSFFKKIEKLGLENRIQLREFIRSDWTYHAKGLWYTLPHEKKPSLTLIGSSNFGYRSVERDLETQIVVVTKNKTLQDNLENEYMRLYKRSKPVDKQTLHQPDRIVPAWVRATTTLFRYFF
ncbi:hypothetical protein HCN44_008443 [Aphidius gifuensis]|uniref:CDP-diacylglycerol--glycerol-3-phosphate 3-phosphatidyltransferase n=1 Tax=Aphidius gifuensis TaxID=684658 RepID=A0A834XR64_APHGI|nr:hypothetical protein HCN44_008443 [Aphidius gifuensis]